ncbi:phenylalanyl-tRNA synthetase beta subunit [Haloactinospora alba]|uniref:Phenylalanine--tRNA ligase beta subunit n=1 Tax=Haloactinospora alba TaxID=405555 RepID=A0A543NHE6_9ACTN|nr:phenylalanine--tRNA ligase subunit beta [Haloactinospora alba]TQN31276.1 phenylalanyl-tRNA synthetase beta subunit [Haloactinospora alba]
MRVPVSWLRDYVDLPERVTARDLATQLIAAGLEVETVDEVGSGVSGPVVLGEVSGVEELTGFKKPIRYCQVDVGTANGTGEQQNIVCGASNFAVGDRVVVALPGSVLPGGFEINARTTYGKVSEGMICSPTELGMWEEHTGILVLPADTGAPGDDALERLGVRDDVLDIAVTPDRGYALSIRGVAREAATIYDATFRDPADVHVTGAPEGGYPATVADAAICSRYVLRGASGLDPEAPTPLWMKLRLARSGVRPISLPVDVTNYVMMELGQPLHAWDRAKLRGPIEVRRARSGEQLETLDHVKRALDPDDIVITDESGPINIAGVMGGIGTEIGLSSSDVVVEAAHFAPTHIARASRRHQLSSESSRRFERDVDSAVQTAAATRAVGLLAELGGAAVDPGYTDIDLTEPREPIVISGDLPDRIAGVEYPPHTALRRLREVGCRVVEDDAGGTLRVTPPTWRPDLVDPNDLAEEVIRYEGYENIPSVPPRAPAGQGLTSGQRLRRALGRGLAGAGFTEVLNYPFVGERDLDGLQLEDDDERRRALRLANPLNEDEALLRTTLVPGLLKALARNVGRGFSSVALFETGLVYRPDPDAPEKAPILRVDRGPTAEELAEVRAALPDQPHRVAAVLTGDREASGWWGTGRPATWADAVEAAREVARIAGAELTVENGQYAPWHPGRCAALYVDGGDGRTLVGHAGELHPRAVHAYGLPARTAAMEVDLGGIEAARVAVRAPTISTFPVATQDVALIVDESVPAGDVEQALREGAGDLLEGIRVFDVYTGDQVGAGYKSLAFSLRFRAADRTLTAAEATAARDAAVVRAAERTGATRRG